MAIFFALFPVLLLIFEERLTSIYYLLPLISIVGILLWGSFWNSLKVETDKAYPDTYAKAEKIGLSLAFRTQLGGYSVSQRVETIVSAGRGAGLNE